MAGVPTRPTEDSTMKALLFALLLTPALLATDEDVVVRTVEGKTLRGRTDRAVLEGPLQLQTSSGALSLPRERVVSVHAVADLRREYRRMRKLAGTDPNRLHQVGTWATSNALYDEMEECFAQVLEAQPFHSGVLAALRAFPLASSNATSDPVRAAREIVARGGRLLKRPVQVVLATFELERLGPDIFEPVLEQTLQGRRADQRAFAARATYVLQPDSSSRTAILLSVLDRSDKVRTFANQVLATRHDEQILPTLRQALASKYAPVRRNAMDAMAALRDPRAVPDLVARITYSGGTGQRVNISNLRQISYVRDFDAEIAQASSIADPVIDVLQEGSVLDVTLLGTHGTADITLERTTALGALRDITGERFRDVKAWETWWAEHGDEAVRAYDRARGIERPEDPQRIR